MKVLIAYYPPSHGKYNLIEIVAGDILDSTEIIFKFVGTMAWRGSNPVINLVDKVYEAGRKVKN